MISSRHVGIVAPIRFEGGMMLSDGTLPVLKEGRYDIRAPFPEQN